MDGMEMSGMSGMGGTDGGSSGAVSVRLNAAQVASFGVTFDTASMRRLTRTIRATGVVDFDESRMEWVAPKFGGWVEALHVDFTGAPVRAGDPLLDVYSPDLVTAQEELLLAAKMVDSVGSSHVEGVADDARGLLSSARRRLAYWDIDDAQIDRILSSGAVSPTLTLAAPASGVVMKKQVFAGQAFRPGDELYMIADLSEVWINAEVFESDVGLLREGMPVEVTVSALPGKVLEGRVAYVYPTLEDRTRSLRARVTVPNPRGELKPGMYATVKLTRDLGEALVVPSSAVLHSGERAVVFIDAGQGRFEPRVVALGREGDGAVQVLHGLDRGARVVTSAQFLLDSESNLAEVMKAMMAQMNTSDMSGMDMGGMEGMDMTADSAGSGMGGMRMGPDSAGGR